VAPPTAVFSEQLREGAGREVRVQRGGRRVSAGAGGGGLSKEEKTVRVDVTGKGSE